MSHFSKLCTIVAGTFIFGPHAFGAVIVTTDNQVGTGGGSNFTPTYVVSSTDLINGKSPLTSSGNFGLETAGGLPALTDGTYGTINDGVTGGHPAFATAGTGTGAGAGTLVSYSLGANATGYNISNIVVYGGWNDNGRDQQLYTVSYSTVAAPGVFIPITSVNFNPTIAGAVQSATRATISDNTLPFLATGAAAIQFDFSAAVENGYTGYAELDVNGTPVAAPEPATFGLLSAGALALLARRRRA
jgi:hypothetical protein